MAVQVQVQNGKLIIGVAECGAQSQLVKLQEAKKKLF